jgi:tRNA threonylcarbamoyladenosine biosynthesis protein TsaB
MRILAVDTALAACAVAVVDGERTLSRHVAPMERGHQEVLAPLVAQAMAEAGLGFDSLDRIAVTVGPGSFTGVRVGLAFAKGLALALDRPCIGIGTLEALAGEAGAFTAALIDGRKGCLYVQCFQDGVAVMAPDLLEDAVAAARLAELWSGGPARLVGPAAARLEGVVQGAVLEPDAWCDPVQLAGLAARRPTPSGSPMPLYLRAPDARTIEERRAAS